MIFPDAPGAAFMRAAALHESRVAIVDTTGTAFTYRELSERVQAFSEFFSEHNIGAGCRVALLMPKSVSAVAAMLAASLCGAAYIPIDPFLPESRLRFLLDDLEPHLLMAHPDFYPSHLPCQQQFSSTASPDESSGITILPAGLHEEELACILYTSGSTGIPKGVCLSPEALMAFVRWGIETFRPVPDDVLSSIAPLHFDLSVFDIYVALLSGASVVLVGEQDSKNARLLTQLLDKSGVSIAYATPSTWRMMMDFGKASKYAFSKLRCFLFAGEVFYPEHLHRWMLHLTQAKFFNLYGPTETNVSHAAEIMRDDARREPYPIGQLLPGFQMHIDQNSGELWLCGPQVFSAYWKREEQTNQAFVVRDNQRWYRTGDRVYVDENGQCVFAGRIDRMIKKRGYRIEPGEVEAALLRHPLVLDAAVFALKDADGYDRMLAAAATGGRNISPEEMREHCANLLAEAAIPDQFIFLANLPKTSSGKTDFDALKQNC